MFKGLFDDNQEGKPKHRCTPGSDCGHIDDKSIWNGDHTKSQEYEYSRLATVGDLVSINRRITESNQKQKNRLDELQTRLTLLETRIAHLKQGLEGRQVTPSIFWRIVHFLRNLTW